MAICNVHYQFPLMIKIDKSAIIKLDRYFEKLNEAF